MRRDQKILLLDIETAPHVAFVWGTFQQNIAPSQLKQHGRTLCWAAQWYGSSKIEYMSERNGGQEAMIRRIHELLSEADIVVTYNGASFDIPTLNNSFVQHKLKPYKKLKHVDLYRVVRSRFRLASNKLEHVVTYLGIGAKVSHKGFALWLGCMNGDGASWRTMERYNKGDVVLLEKVYDRLRPWVENHPDVAVSSKDAHCPSCGSTDLQSRGVRHTKALVIGRIQCNSCGSWSDGIRRRRAKAAA